MPLPRGVLQRASFSRPRWHDVQTHHFQHANAHRKVLPIRSPAHFARPSALRVLRRHGPHQVVASMSNRLPPLQRKFVCELHPNIHHRPGRARTGRAPSVFSRHSVQDRAEFQSSRQFITPRRHRVLLLPRSQLDFTVPVDTTSFFPVFLALVCVFDFLFGILHYLSHCNPYLCGKHALHHTYRKEHLNLFANCCSDIVDSVCMNFGLIVISIYLCKVGKYHIPFLDLIYGLAHTHCRYNTHHMNLMYFFEYDLVDMMCGKERFSCFHADHHRDSSRNFAVFGFFQDEVFRRLLPSFRPVNEQRKA